MNDKGGGEAVAGGIRGRRTVPWRRVLLVAGPGLIVMLADTDVGSIVTAAQSGAQWGYQFLPVQFLIIPLLYIVQELTVRLGVTTGKGYAELVFRHFGRFWSIIAVGAVIVSCFGALVTEISGLASVGQMFGVQTWEISLLSVALIFIMVLTGSYRSVERIAICLGLFELAFFAVAWHAHPDVRTMATESLRFPFGERRYLYLLAANLGTSVMPWTVFYQQSAIADKGLTRRDLHAARLETLLGAILCQLVTAAILVAAAAAFRHNDSGTNLRTVQQIADAITPALGDGPGRIVFALGLSGAASVAVIVVCLTAAWAVGEVTGVHHSLDHRPTAAPWFYGAFGVILLAGGILVASGVNLVRLSLTVGVINAVMLPVVLGALYQLARIALPEADRLKGSYALIVGVIFCLTAGIGVYSGIFGIEG